MSKKFNECSKEVSIINELGLHARSAAKIAEIAQHAQSQVWITKEKETVDAKSIIDMLTLACAKGTKIIITIDSKSDINVLNNIIQVVEDGFGE